MSRPEERSDKVLRNKENRNKENYNKENRNRMSHDPRGPQQRGGRNKVRWGKRFLPAGLALSLLLLLLFLDPPRAEEALSSIGYSLKELLLVIPPVFVILGLLDVWISREQLMRHMGHQAGFRGTLIAFVMGSVAAGPLYAAFPVAAMLVKKGSSFFNVMVFIGAWSTTKIPMFLFEYTSLGPAFALTRLGANIPAILLMALLLSKMVPRELQGEMYRMHEED